MRAPAFSGFSGTPGRSLGAAGWPSGSTMTGTKVERDRRITGSATRRLRRRPRARRGAPSRCRPADGVPRRRRAPASRRTIVCGAPNVAAGQTVAVARPGALMPDGTKLGAAKLRGVKSEGMILAEDELGDRQRPHGDRGAGRGLGARPAPRWPRCCRSPTTCSSWRSRRTDPTASASTGSRARSTRPPAPRSRRRRGPRTRDRRGELAGVELRVEVPDAVPALHGALVRRRQDRSVAAVAEGAARGRRAAPDLQRGGHHQLRDAAHRPAAARLRLRPRRRRAAGRAPRPATARRSTTLDGRAAAPRRRRGGDRRRRRSDLDRRDHGRRALGGRRRHHPRADGGRHLERARTSTAARSGSACAARPRPASRSSSSPSPRWRRRPSPPG